MLIVAAALFAFFLGFAWLLRFFVTKIHDAAQSDVVIEMRFSKEYKENVQLELMQFSYYNKLSNEGKKKFFDRVLIHLSKNKVVGAEGYEPDDKIKIMISATAAQLTFHIDKDWLASFDTVELHPTIFRMNHNGPLMKGATTPNGIIRISVKDYLEGYRVGDDKLNVGLHEFAHALLIEYTASAEDYSDIKKLVFPYEVIAAKEIELGPDSEHFLRKYAFTNKHEFFAVSVETFFEAPKDFFATHPELYIVLTKLLNQDPRNVTEDYRLQERLTE
ncbi:MAG: zinc-dependent peptidase [Bacteroidetes bacterium]|nr:zinc-dependent peptidase [Bacteroidota bacterium]